MSSGTARSSWLGFLMRSLGLLLAALGLGVGALFYLNAPQVPEIPAVSSISDQRASLVTSRRGEAIARLGRRKGAWTPLSKIDSSVVGALLATEDRRFYDHPGVDWRRSLAAVLHTLTGDLQGGSTLTQQLARNLFPERIGTAPTLSRKALEILTALRIEEVYTKDEILEVYLNTVPFLYGAFGIEMAARTYFGTSADALSVSEAATLVAMLKGPAYYNPVRHPERARSRRNLVLRMMVDTGRLSPKRYETLRSQPLNLSFRSQLLRDSPAPHFTEYVRKQLESWCRTTGCDPYRDGLRVQTSLDLRMQERARRGLRRQSRILQGVVDRAWSRPELRVVSANWTAAREPDRPEDAFAHFWDERPELLEELIRETEAYRSLRDTGQKPEEAVRTLRRDEAFVRQLKQRTTRLEASLVAIDPATGGVRIWVGSRNFELEQYDHVAQARRQPGSTFKPFVYAAALEDGYDPETPLVDEPITIRTASGERWRPSNAGPVTGEPIPLRQGLIQSKNTITARLVKAIGPEPVVRVAERMGVRSSPLEAVPSVGLGTSEVSLLEMTNAYASFVREGAYRPVHAIRTILSAEGDTLAAYGPPGDVPGAGTGGARPTSPDEPAFEVEQAVDSTTARSVLGMMQGVVEEGTGQDLRRRFGIDAQVGGKTGTTQGGADGWFFLVHRDLVAGSWVGFNDPRVRFRTSYWGQGARTGLRVVGDVAARLLEDGLLDPNAPLPTSDRSDGPLIDLEPVAERVGSWLRRVADHLRGPSSERSSSGTVRESRGEVENAPPTRENGTVEGRSEEKTDPSSAAESAADREDSSSRRGGW